ncbi:neprosin family prolyl endopeptidase [uncultured Xanthomonas sp.]|uniref:neprosin family prolyl endopeptidase n=1 Tax=uncultured Xanthomonas sp. TaxID=152831 RepID=UPI0025E75336|nr:neprosin family prolyl endopeptidase [uncultured Xanthomonas sp.]
MDRRRPLRHALWRTKFVYKINSVAEHAFFRVASGEFAQVSDGFPPPCSDALRSRRGIGMCTRIRAQAHGWGRRFGLHAMACLLLGAGAGVTGAANAALLTDAAARDVDRVMPPLRSATALPQVQPSLAATASVADGFASPAFPRVTAEFARFRARDAALTLEQLPASRRRADPAAFAQMQRYLFNRYNGVTVVRTLSVDGHLFDCIPLSQQPGMRDVARVASPPPRTGGPIAEPHQAAPATRCNAGTVPLQRIGINDLAKAHSLREFLDKQPSSSDRGERVTAAAASDGHHYASVFANTAGSPIHGAGADLNIWTPVFRSSNDYMSISQIWLYGQSASQAQQTLEVGWQLRPSYADWGDKSITFIYSTQDGYATTGCHNLECGDFVQVVSGNVLGTPYPADRYSVRGGKQTLLSVGYQRDADGNWWLMLDGDWIGYYKASLYSGDLATGSSAIGFSAGGETYAEDLTPSTPMGSGAFANAGYRNAAFQANHFYLDASLASHAVTRLSGYAVDDPACYTLALSGLSGPSSTGVGSTALAPEMRSGGFYFGGPGCTP